MQRKKKDKDQKKIREKKSRVILSLKLLFLPKEGDKGFLIVDTKQIDKNVMKINSIKNISHQKATFKYQ